MSVTNITFYLFTQILKNQLGQLAPDAATLISRGDSLVYAKHKDNPLLADYIQTHFQVVTSMFCIVSSLSVHSRTKVTVSVLQDKLRNKWSMVMSEIELKRNLALTAEDNVKELTELVAELQAWCDALPNNIDDDPVSALRLDHFIIIQSYNFIAIVTQCQVILMNLPA